MNDFSSIYFTSISDIPEGRLQQIRSRLTSREILLRPNLDVRPNSVYGDLFLDPATEVIASLEGGMAKFKSDMDPRNAAKGIIYDCDFVEAFLENFGINPLQIKYAVGYLVLEFPRNTNLSLPRSMRFLFGGEARYAIDLPLPGGLEIRAVNSEMIPGTNNVRMVWTGTSYQAIIRVVGDAPESVGINSPATVNQLDEYFTDIYSLDTFMSGYEIPSLVERAQRTRLAAHSTTPNSRGGVKLYLSRELPETSLRSAVFSSDEETLRSLTGLLGVAPALMDVFVRMPKQQTGITSIYMNLAVDSGQFIHKLNLPHNPGRILSIRVAGTSTPLEDYTVFSQSSNPARAPLATAAGSKLENLWVSIPMGVIPTTLDGEGNPVALFEVEYTYDPSVSMATSRLEDSEDTPWLDVLVRPGVSQVFKSLEITYRRESGVRMSLAQARSDIYDYVNAVAYPDVISEARIATILSEAGASVVERVTPHTIVQWSAASSILPASADLLDDYTAALASAVTLPVVEFMSMVETRAQYLDPALGTSNETLVSGGPRNWTYMLDEDAIKFIEL